MGNFNIACGFSSLAIQYKDRAGFQLLVESPDTFATPAKNRTSSPYRFSAFEDFRLLLGPVYGTYNDSGHIVDIEDNATTAILEKYFNRPADTIIRCIISNTGPYGDDIYTTYGIGSDFICQSEAFSFSPNEILTHAGFVHSNGLWADLHTGVTLSNHNGIWRADSHGGIQIDTLTHRNFLQATSEATGELVGFTPGNAHLVRTLQAITGMAFRPDIEETVWAAIEENYYIRTRMESMNRQVYSHLEMTDLVRNPDRSINEDAWESLTASMLANDGHSSDKASLAIYRCALGTRELAESVMAGKRIGTIAQELNRECRPTFHGNYSWAPDAQLALARKAVQILEQEQAETA